MQFLTQQRLNLELYFIGSMQMLRLNGCKSVEVYIFTYGVNNNSKCIEISLIY
jgi:hypothetical protein